MEKNLNEHLTKEDTEMANKYMQRCSSTFVISELKIKTEMRSQTHLLERLMYKTLAIPNVGENMELQELSLFPGGTAKSYSYF